MYAIRRLLFEKASDLLQTNNAFVSIAFNYKSVWCLSTFQPQCGWNGVICATLLSASLCTSNLKTRTLARLSAKVFVSILFPTAVR
jgi:hypothetical protein